VVGHDKLCGGLVVDACDNHVDSVDGFMISIAEE
jgi:hypothetical protein